jgi:phenylacetyl-CoA:acceptor oxidoreductase subunit 2
MTYGPNPWQQTHWDARAAGNFICGGCGAGLIAFAALAGAEGRALSGLMVAGLGLIAAGLFCVFLETGRPLRAMNVLINPRTSWMTREAFTAAVLFPVGVAIVLGAPHLALLAAALALAFVFCQSRMLRAAKGIPAWREPAIVPLIVATGLAEGAGWFLVGLPVHGIGGAPVLALFGVLVLVRVFVWLAYRRRVAATLARGAFDALEGAGRVLQVGGTLAPLALVALELLGVVPGPLAAPLAALAGLLAAAAGAYLKLVLVTRAGFNQGFAIPHLPVRGQPH